MSELDVETSTIADESGLDGVDESHEHVQVRERLADVMRPAFAEFLGSALFIFIACGAAVNTASFKTPGPTVIAVALAFGLTIFVLAFTIGHISGCHLNIVVSFSFALVGKITWLRAIAYCLAQFFGGLVGAGFLRIVTPDQWFAPGCLASNFVQNNMTASHGFLVEIIMTFFLLMVICAATDANKSNQIMVPLAIGFAVTVCHLMAVPITGTSLNPTRSFASAAVSSQYVGCSEVWNDHWVFWFGPLIGGVLGTLTYEFIFHDGKGRGMDLMNVFRGHIDAIIR